MKLRLQVFLTFLLCILASKAESSTATFDWTQPKSLTPAYDAPTITNRTGACISGVAFTDNGVTLTITDPDTQETSLKARFVFDYYTNAVEMRADRGATITIVANDGSEVFQVNFSGAQVDENYFDNLDHADCTSSNGTLSVANAANAVSFTVSSQIHCDKITVLCREHSAVSYLFGDDAATGDDVRWFSIDGAPLNSQPSIPGLYFKLKGNTTKKVLIR